MKAKSLLVLAVQSPGLIRLRRHEDGLAEDQRKVRQGREVWLGGGGKKRGERAGCLKSKKVR
jgi:hypothetical protein